MKDRRESSLSLRERKMEKEEGDHVLLPCAHESFRCSFAVLGASSVTRCLSMTTIASACEAEAGRSQSESLMRKAMREPAALVERQGPSLPLQRDPSLLRSLTTSNLTLCQVNLCELESTRILHDARWATTKRAASMVDDEIWTRRLAEESESKQSPVVAVD